MIEEYKPGYKRRIILDARGVVVDTCHQVSADGVLPEVWSGWSFWGRFKTVEDAIAAHNAAVSAMPALWCNGSWSSSLTTRR